MFGNFSQYLAVFLTGLLVAYLLTPQVRALAVRFGVVDLPNQRRPHTRPTARGGGLAVVLGVYSACLVAVILVKHGTTPGLNLVLKPYFLAASAVLVLIGLLDDVRGLGPWVKLAGQAVAAALIALSGTHFGQIFGFHLPAAVDFVLVVIWLLAIVNAFNLIDGLDGLASGLAVISAVGLGGMILITRAPGDLVMLLALIGACLGFLRYNFHPASIFLGDTGSMFIGFVLGVVSLHTFTKNTFVLSLTIPMLVLGVPIYDALLAIWRRSVRIWLAGGRRADGSTHLGIMQPDVEHLHHRLLKAGLSTQRVATLLFVLNAALVLLGVLATTFTSHASGIFLLALLAAVYVLMRHLAVIELRDTGRALLTGLRRPTHATFKALLYPVWDMFCLAGAVALAMRFFEPATADFWHSWFLELPVWVTPTFSLLATSRTYLTVWTRARVLDVLMLLFTLMVGSVLSLGIALVIDPAAAGKLLLRALVVAGTSGPAIVGVRVFYRVMEELVAYFRSKSEPKAGRQRVLLFGAGGRCQLFLKERGFSNSQSYDSRLIVGLLDDEPSLRGQWVYGSPVLGGRKELPRIVSARNINEIIITAGLNPECRAELRRLAGELGLQLSEWCFETRKLEVDVPAPATAPVPAQG